MDTDIPKVKQRQTSGKGIPGADDLEALCLMLGVDKTGSMNKKSLP